MRLWNSTNVPITIKRKKEKKKIPLIFLQARAIDPISFSIMILASRNYDNKITKYSDYCVTWHGEEAGEDVRAARLGSRADTFPFWLMFVLPLAAAVLGSCYVTALAGWSPPAADMLGF